MPNITDAEKNALIQEIISKIKDTSSTAMEELDSVTTLDGIESLPAIRGEEFVKAPVSLLSKKAEDAATRAENATSDLTTMKDGITKAIKKTEDLVTQGTEVTDKAKDAAARAEVAATKFEQSALIARNGATVKLDEIIESLPSSVVPKPSTDKTSDLRVIYVSSTNKVYATDGTDYFISWPSSDTYINSAGDILKDRLYLAGEKLYSWNSTVNKLTLAGGGGNTLNILGDGESTGSYTLMTAIQKVPVDARKNGKCITYPLGDGKWETKQFTGTDIANWSDLSKWDDFGGGGKVKKILVNGRPQEIKPDGSVDLAVTEVTVDSTIDENSTNPVQSKVIAAELKKFMSKDNLGIELNTIGSGADTKFSISLTDKGEAFATTDPFSGGGGGGGGQTSPSKIVLTRVTPATLTVKSGTEVKISYKYDHVDIKTEETTGLPGKATISITHGTNVTTYTKTIAAGNSDTIDATSALGEGTNMVRVRMQVEIGQDDQTGKPIYSTYTMSWTVNVVNLVLGSTFKIDSVINRGDIIVIPFTVSGSGNKTVKCILNGEDLDSRAIVSSTGNGSFPVNTKDLTHGAHSVQLVCELLLTGGEVLKSKSFYFDMAVREPNRTEPIIATAFEFEDGSIIDVKSGARPYIKAKQFDSYTLTYAAYDPVKTPATVFVREGGVLVSQANVNFATTNMTTRAISSGELSCSITVRETVYNYKMNIVKSDINLSEPVDNIKLKLTAAGRSNSDTDRTVWKDTEHNITANLTGVKFGGDGWTNGGLLLRDGGKAVIPYKPLQQPQANITNSMSFLIKFKVSSVIDETSPLIKCMDNGVGFVVTANEARFVSRGGSTLSMPLAEGNTYEIGFISYPEAGGNSSDDEKLNSKVNYLYINGIASGSIQRGLSDSIYQANPQNIELGGLGANLYVYSVRAWNYYLTDDQVLDCWILDQDSSETLLNKFKLNDIVDGSGNITTGTITSLPYIIITGKAENGMAQVLNAAVQNAKSPKYDITSMLFIDPTKERKNWYCEGGCIRLQGTSSLAYPIKNYRIYFKNSKKEAGKLYVGCDDKGQGGELQAKPKLSFHEANKQGKKPAKVDCFCLKADYAESSSSHNTGMARFANDVLIAANSLTPPQANIKTDEYEYEVRTTIDGYPVLMFYRANVEDVPVFLGKYNFNNDKSTEDVFGFLDIPGYNSKDLNFGGFTEIIAPSSVTDEAGLKSYASSFDKSKWEKGDEAAKVKPKIYVFSMFDGPHYVVYEYKKETNSWELSTKKVNTTECWEFSNNDYPMGQFLDADFVRKAQDSSGKSIPNWMNAFEVRFPDDKNQTKAHEAGKKLPYWLKRMVTWLNSTKDNPNKFKNEVGDYFDLNYLCDYYMLTVIFGCVDQRVKNMMWGFWYDPKTKKMLCYPIFYDCDTILGVRNDGRLKYKWDINDDTIDQELTAAAGTTKYAYAGHDSVVWNNLKKAFPDKLEESYKRLRTAMGGSNAMIYRYFDTEQADKFCERIYNIDAQNKYISPLTKGVQVVKDGGQVSNQTYNFIECMQGSRKAHRHWWLENRMALLDAKHATGQYSSSEINWKGVTDAGVTVKATSSRDFYFEIYSDSVTQHDEVKKGVQWTFTYNQAANIGSIFHLLGIRFMETLDLSGWGGFQDIQFIGTLPVLTELTLGTKDSGKRYETSNVNLVGRDGEGNTISVIPMVKKIKLENFNAITTLDLTGATRLEEIYLGGCNSLRSITIEEGIPLKKLELPRNFKSLYLRSLNDLSMDDIVFEDKTSIENLWIENCKKINGLEVFKSLLNLAGNKIAHVRLVGLNISGDGSDLLELMSKNIGGIDAKGNTIARCALYGDYYLTRYMDDIGEESPLAKLRKYFDLNIHQVEYTIIELTDAIKRSGQWIDVASTKNVSNHDNRTGFLYGNTYVPSGHVTKIMSERHRVLAKNTKLGLTGDGTDGEMTYCILDDSNSGLYYNGDIAQVDGSQGDLCVYEPHFWYKGVNDYLNKKNYLVWSANREKPSVAPYKSINLQQLKALGGYWEDKTINSSGSVTTLAGLSVCTVDVSGWKRVRFTTIEDGYSVFVDDSDSRVGEIVTTQADDFSPGMYVIADIPQGAKKLKFVYYPPSYFEPIILSNSDKLEDMEPDWVEHKPELRSVNYINSAGRSVHGSSGKISEITPASISSLLSGVNKSGWNLRNYSLFVSFLVYSCHGDRNPILMGFCNNMGAWDNWCTTGQANRTNVGGMEDSFVNSGQTYIKTGSETVRYGAGNLNWASTLGYSGTPLANGISPFQLIAKASRGNLGYGLCGLSDQHPDGTYHNYIISRTLYFRTGNWSGLFTKRIFLGKYMILFHAGAGAGTSSSTHYATAHFYHFRYLSYRGNWNGYVVGSQFEGYELASRYIFSGDLVKEVDVNKYLGIRDVVFN